MPFCAANSENQLITVALVEDDLVSQQLLARYLDAEHDIQVIGVAATVARGIALLALQPDVLLVDLGLPDGSGLDLIRMACASNHRIEVAALTAFDDQRHVIAAIEHGATGYLLKDSEAKQVADAVRDLVAGRSPISPAIARHLLLRIHASDARPVAASSRGVNALTPRETAVLQQIAKGYSYEDVSKVLGISVNTVTSHIKRIYSKLAVHSRGEAVFEATQLGLIRLDTSR